MKKVNFKKASKLLKQGDFYLIDIRSPYLFNKGHFPNSYNVPYDTFVKMIPKYLNKDFNYLVICERGIDSKEIVKILSDYNFKAYHIKGGIIKYHGPLASNIS